MYTRGPPICIPERALAVSAPRSARTCFRKSPGRSNWNPLARVRWSLEPGAVWFLLWWLSSTAGLRSGETRSNRS